MAESMGNTDSEARLVRAPDEDALSAHLPLREYTAFRYSAPPGSCKCGKCQLVPHATVAHYADEIDRLAAELDYVQADCLENAATISRLTAERDAMKRALDALWVAYQDDDNFRRVFAELISTHAVPLTERAGTNGANDEMRR